MGTSAEGVKLTPTTRLLDAIITLIQHRGSAPDVVAADRAAAGVALDACLTDRLARVVGRATWLHSASFHKGRHERDLTDCLLEALVTQPEDTTMQPETLSQSSEREVPYWLIEWRLAAGPVWLGSMEWVAEASCARRFKTRGEAEEALNRRSALSRVGCTVTEHLDVPAPRPAPPQPTRYTAPDPLPVGKRVRIVELASDDTNLRVGDISIYRGMGIDHYLVGVQDVYDNMNRAWVRTVELAEEESRPEESDPDFSIPIDGELRQLQSDLTAALAANATLSASLAAERGETAKLRQEAEAVLLANRSLAAARDESRARVTKLEEETNEWREQLLAKRTELDELKRELAARISAHVTEGFNLRAELAAEKRACAQWRESYESLQGRLVKRGDDCEFWLTRNRKARTACESGDLAKVIAALDGNDK